MKKALFIAMVLPFFGATTQAVQWWELFFGGDNSIHLGSARKHKIADLETLKARTEKRRQENPAVIERILERNILDVFAGKEVDVHEVDEFVINNCEIAYFRAGENPYHTEDIDRIKKREEVYMKNRAMIPMFLEILFVDQE